MIKWRNKIFKTLMLAVTMFMLSFTALAVNPSPYIDLGSQITNTATLNYTGADGAAQTETATVTVTVGLYGEVALTPDYSPNNGLKGLPLGFIGVFGHTVQNLGNGPEAYDLTGAFLTADAANNHSGEYSYKFYKKTVDRLENEPGGGTQISATDVIAAGGTFDVWFTVQTPSDTPQNRTDLLGTWADVRIIATGQLSGATDFATDRLEYQTEYANIVVNKAFMVNGNPQLVMSGSRIADQTVSFQITIQNNSVYTDATAVKIDDQIDPKFTNVTNVMWNGAPATGYTFSGGTLSYDLEGGTIEKGGAIFGTLTFDATVAANTALGQIKNTAIVTYNNDETENSNEITYTVTGKQVVEITSNQTGYTYADGSKLYTHTVTNLGDAINNFTLNYAGNLAESTTTGWTYMFTDATGTTQENLPVLNLAAFGQAGNSATIYIKAIPGGNGTDGQVNLLDVTGTFQTPSAVPADDSVTKATDTTYILSRLTVKKYYSLSNDDGTTWTNFVEDGESNMPAIKPGITDQIRYKIVVTNPTTVTATEAAATNVYIEDSLGAIPYLQYLIGTAKYDKNSDTPVSSAAYISGSQTVNTPKTGIALEHGDTLTLIFDASVDVQQDQD